MISRSNNILTKFGAVEVLGQNGKGLDFNGYKPTYQLLDSYDHLIKGSDSDNESKIVARGGLNETTIAIKNVIDDYKYQLELLASHLKADSLEQSTFHIWHFIKKNIRYDFDLAGVEEIRTPARTWKDRLLRSDCEDYAIFASALLINMGYSPTLRIVAFNNKDYYQHIYVVINGITIDAVLNQFNIEPEKITKVMDIKVLSGLGEVEQSDAITEKLMINQSGLIHEHRKTKCANKKKAIMRELRKVRYLLVIQGTEERNQIMPIMSNIHDITADGTFIFKKSENLESVANYLESVNNMDEKEISGLGAVGFKNKMAGSQIETLKNQRDIILELIDSGIATEEESREILFEMNNLINEGLNGLGSVNGLSGWLSKIKKGIKKSGSFLSRRIKAAAAKAKKLAKAAASKVRAAAAATARAAKAAAAKAKKIAAAAAKKTWKFIKKFNPLTVLARNAYLGLLRLNFRGWGEDMARGYSTHSKLAKKGYSTTDRNKIFKRKAAIEKKWKSLGGNTGSLRKAVLASKKSKRVISGVDGLGVVVASAAAALAAAAPVIKVIKAVMGVFKIGRSINSKVKSFFPRHRDQNVKDKEEQDFINNELVNDTRSGSSNSGDSGKKKDNTRMWIGAASIVAVLGVGIGIYVNK